MESEKKPIKSEATASGVEEDHNGSQPSDAVEMDEIHPPASCEEWRIDQRPLLEGETPPVPKSRPHNVLLACGLTLAGIGAELTGMGLSHNLAELVAGVGALASSFGMFHGAYLRHKANMLLAASKERLTHIGQRVSAMMLGTHPFIPPKSSGFSGKTLVQYTKAYDMFLTLRLLHRAGERIIHRSLAEIESCRPPFIHGVKRAISLQTREQTKVELPGGTIHCTPEFMNSQMQVAFDQAMKELLIVAVAYNQARKQQEAHCIQFNKLKPLVQQLTESGLSFEPYRASYDKLKNLLLERDRVCISDPMSACDGDRAFQSGYKDLTSNIQRAQDALTRLQKARADLSGVEAVKRGKPVSYRYPGSAESDEQKTVMLTFDEETLNPQSFINKANDLLSGAMNDLGAGQVQQALSAMYLAEQEIRNATATIDRALDTKKQVEERAASSESYADKYASYKSKVEHDLSLLQAEFHPNCFLEQQEFASKLGSIRQNIQETLEQAKLSYDRQCYRNALSLLEGDSLSGQMKNNSVGTRLEQLRQLKTERLNSLQSAEALKAIVSALLSDNAFTTATATEQLFEKLLADFDSQRQLADLEILDWPAAVNSAAELVKSLQELESAIAEQKSRHLQLIAKVVLLQKTVDDIQSNVIDCVMQPARDNLCEVISALTDLEESAKAAHSDWLALLETADLVASAATQAGKLVMADRTARDGAESRIKSVQRALQHLRHARNRKLEDVRMQLSIAVNAFGARDYNTAYDAAGSALSISRAIKSQLASRAVTKRS